MAVLEVDGGDVAHPDARHPDRLALSRGHGLRRGHLRLQLERLLLEQRDPQALVLDDDVGREHRHHQQAEDGNEVAQMVADRLAHQRPAFFVGEAGAAASIPLAFWKAAQSLLQAVNWGSTVAISCFAAGREPSARSFLTLANSVRSVA